MTDTEVRELQAAVNQASRREQTTWAAYQAAAQRVENAKALAKHALDVHHAARAHLDSLARQLILIDTDD